MTDGTASAETGTPTPDGGRQPASLAPMGLGLALALFGISSVIVTLSLFVGVPALTRAGLSPFATFTIAFLVPLALMFFVALAAYRLEARPWNWRAFAERMRLGRMRPSGWAWSIALALFMFPLGGTIRWIAAGLLAVVAVWLDGVRGRQAGVLIAAVLAWVGATWAFAVFGGSTANVVFFVTPKPVADLLGMIQPTSFMGISLAGAWWLIPFYLVLMFFNIIGEELWWRGYILPRQELRHGRYAWIVHGLMWTAFHAFWISNLHWGLAHIPTALALSYICQRQQNTWPGIIGHFVGNSPILILIVSGVVG